jgi:hypothetical protein
MRTHLLEYFDKRVVSCAVNRTRAQYSGRHEELLVVYNRGREREARLENAAKTTVSKRLARRGG